MVEVEVVVVEEEMEVEVVVVGSSGGGDHARLKTRQFNTQRHCGRILVANNPSKREQKKRSNRYHVEWCTKHHPVVSR